jgi:hypothetical protein
MQTFELQLPPELQSSIEFIKKEIVNLKENYQPKEPKKYLTRAEVSRMLSVDISTVHNMCKRKILQKYQISGRILFLRSEVEKSIVKINN